MAKKTSKPKKQARAEPRSAPDDVLFGWREPRKRALCRPSSAYRFLADLNGKDTPNLAADGRYLYLGPIPNRRGYCAVVELATGRVLTDNHPEDFEELPEGRTENTSG